MEKRKKIDLLCITGICGAGSSLLIQYLENENEIFDLCEKDKWKIFSFNEIDIPCRNNNERILNILNELTELIKDIKIDDYSIRSDLSISEILTIDNYIYNYEKRNGSFRGCIESLLYNDDCLHITNEELIRAKINKKEIDERIDRLVWIESLIPYINEITNKIIETTSTKFVFDLGGIIIPDIISIVENNMFNNKKICEIHVIQIVSDPYIISKRWVNDIIENDLPPEDYIVYRNDIYRDGFINMFNEDKDEEFWRVRFLNAIKKVRKGIKYIENFERFVYKNIKIENQRLNDLTKDIYWLSLIKQNRVHIINNRNDLDDFKNDFFDIINEIYPLRNIKKNNGEICFDDYINSL